jgi:hypothetical protein
VLLCIHAVARHVTLFVWVHVPSATKCTEQYSYYGNIVLWSFRGNRLVRNIIGTVEVDDSYPVSA